MGFVWCIRKPSNKQLIIHKDVTLKDEQLIELVIGIVGKFALWRQSRLSRLRFSVLSTLRFC